MEDRLNAFPLEVKDEQRLNALFHFISYSWFLPGNFLFGPPPQKHAVAILLVHNA
jgi:hypothetical protein